jgi:valyl-tRNA synthetase
MPNELPAQYDPSTREKNLYDFWLKEKVFTADEKSEKPKYVITQPPPNVTGVLHMGHALSYTLEDILIRWKRMEGFNSLWVPGTDHAGIATQMVVERKLLKEQKISRHDLGREEFLKKVWEWKEASQNTILSQMRLLGCGPDWDRIKFTLDADVSRAVREAFVRLFNEGLIYRDNAITQWCPRCGTALSDLEVKAQEKKSKLWHIRYLSKSDPSSYLVVATTRPETLLGDTAVAVHPSDERYTAFHGKTVIVPLANREIPVITDSYVEKDFGTGALKITPAHDPNDYEVAKRHKLPSINIMDDKAHLNEAAGSYRGLSREKAREKIIDDLKAQNLLEKEVDYTHSVGHCDRCQTVVEPKLGLQWFVKTESLAAAAIRAVESKEIRIIPEEWEKTYFEWMRNIRPWCISRQLWWGHRIPVWYCSSCNGTFALIDAPKTCSKCGGAQLKQDEDVLDTWFSSGLWPFSTLGWPSETEAFKKFYPTDTMETGFDILFFWVARMIMLGIKMTGKIPFRDVYLHPMVRDEYGQKMSKTKGNVVDPLEIINRMGADPLRFFLASNAFHGRDLRVSDEGVEGCRNFVNKIWNASRFVFLNFSATKASKQDLSNDVNAWIWTRLDETKAEVQSNLEKFRFFDAARDLYQFIWNDYCSWFLELIKGEDEIESRQKTGESTPMEVLEEALRLLHPFMPFVTEELWQRLPVRAPGVSIALAEYPKAAKEGRHPDAFRRIARLIRVVEGIRNKRGTSNLNPNKEIRVLLFADKNVIKELSPLEARIKKMVRASEIHFIVDAKPDSKSHILIPTSDVEIYIPKDDLGDMALEAERTQKEISDIRGALERAKAKLGNKSFTDRAPEIVVNGVRAEAENLEKKLLALEKYLGEIGA